MKCHNETQQTFFNIYESLENNKILGTKSRNYGQQQTRMDPQEMLENHATKTTSNILQKICQLQFTFCDKNF